LDDNEGVVPGVTLVEEEELERERDMVFSLEDEECAVSCAFFLTAAHTSGDVPLQ